MTHTDVGDTFLAFLSACDTFTAGDVVPDECLTVGSAPQLTGYRHVIATQWPVCDGGTADLAAVLRNPPGGSSAFTSVRSGQTKQGGDGGRRCGPGSGAGGWTTRRSRP
ncbi:CHAT domain-containing protein [Streptomyces sp. cg40]|uniref:CHAT domain-containing protein n=1 Tax=Streptomyces sp. cg40 TaxID=3419764 RepID=UPI003D008AFC